jgi:hypothetical protein
MMGPVSRLLYIAGCIVFIGAGAWITLRWWQSTVTSPGIERLYFSSVINSHETDYLLRLRDTHLGCETITYRDPEVVFLGDSHTYAGWDYLTMQQRLRPYKVGSCALAGMFPENLADFAGLVRVAGLSSRFVIFGIQPRMFWDVPERGDRVARARRMMSEVREARESLPALATGRWRQIDPFVGASASERDKIARLREASGTLDEHIVDASLAANERTLHALDFWLGYVRDGRPFPSVEDVVNDVCNATERAGFRLGVVYIPESRWLNQRYTPEQRQEFVRHAELFRRCADWIDLSAFEAMGFENRHFVNRYLVDNYPYAAWNDMSTAHQWIAENEVERRWQFFDPDHMNASGAGAFTAHMLPRLERWIHGDNGGQE